MNYNCLCFIPLSMALLTMRLKTLNIIFENISALVCCIFCIFVFSSQKVAITKIMESGMNGVMSSDPETMEMR